MPDSENKSGEGWYWAAALFKATHPDRPRRRHLWERCVFLVHASSSEAAQEAALELARGKEHEYLGGSGDRIRWTFVELESVQSLHDPPGHGAEVYWTHFQRVDPAPAGR